MSNSIFTFIIRWNIDNPLGKTHHYVSGNEQTKTWYFGKHLEIMVVYQLRKRNDNT